MACHIVVCSKNVTIQHTTYRERQLFQRTWVGLKAISHLKPHSSKLILFEYDNCKDWNCNSLHHKSLSDLFCSNLIDCCLQSGSVHCLILSLRTELCRVGLIKSNMFLSLTDIVKFILITQKGQGYDNAKQSLFWHWIWSEASRPTRGTLCDIMKRARHKYHYVMQRIRKHNLQMQRDGISYQLCDNNLFLVQHS